MMLPLPARTILLLLSISAAALPAAAFAEANACSESENQLELRTELAKQYGLKRHIEVVPPAVWTLETMDTPRHCEASCRNNLPYDNFYLTYKGFEASGKPCEGQTSVVMTTSPGLLKMLATCMAGCGTAAQPAK